MDLKGQLDDNYLQTKLFLDRTPVAMGFPGPEIVSSSLIQLEDLATGSAGDSLFGDVHRKWVCFKFRDPDEVVGLNIWTPLLWGLHCG